MYKSSTSPTTKNHTISNGPNRARMRSWLLTLLTINLSLLTIQCGLDIEDPTPPSSPVWVQKSLPEEWPERGIDAHESGGIYLEWEPNPEENIASYWLFIARYFPENDSLGEYETLWSNIPESQINFLHSEAAARITYYYKLKQQKCLKYPH